MAPGDPSTLLLQFAAGALASGACHTLQLHGAHGPLAPMMGAPEFEEALLGPELKICTTSCLCDWAGTSSCEAETGQCFCREPHVGADCS
jgi:hypothetical protein